MLAGIRRQWAWAAIGLAAVAALLTHAMATSGGSSAGGKATVPPRAVPSSLGLIPSGSKLVVRAVDEEMPRDDGELYEVSPDDRIRRVGDIACKQVHQSAAGPGICLGLTRDRTAYRRRSFDAAFDPARGVEVGGVPDRARVSADGRYGAFTLFDEASAIGYFASTDDFSTNTQIVDLDSGRVLLELGDLTTMKDGEPLDTPDQEYWGVTFGERGRYYATVATAGHHYLIEGSVRSRRATVVRDRVECPSLSPDGTRIAYKRRLGFRNRWRLHVLNLQTGKDTALAETRSIDDQPEWLGDETVIYSDDESIFAVPADGSGEPVALVERATSPVYIAAP